MTRNVSVTERWKSRGWYTRRSYSRFAQSPYQRKVLCDKICCLYSCVRSSGLSHRWLCNFKKCECQDWHKPESVNRLLATQMCTWLISTTQWFSYSNHHETLSWYITFQIKYSLQRRALIMRVWILSNRCNGRNCYCLIWTFSISVFRYENLIQYAKSMVSIWNMSFHMPLT